MAKIQKQIVRGRYGATGLAMLGLFLLLFCLFNTTPLRAEICGFREKGSVDIVRGKTVVATFTVTLADTVERRRQGLMYCPHLAPGAGMLFTYPNARRLAFWMKDTRIELAIIFISADNRITNIEHGVPGNRDRIFSSGAARYVLEVNYGERHELAVGDRVHMNVDSD